jgi:hypothetical protein
MFVIGAGPPVAWKSIRCTGIYPYNQQRDFGD